MSGKNVDRFMKEFFLGFVKVHILYHTGQRPFFGRELKDELEEHGYLLSYGTLYPLLHRLCRDGCLKRETRTTGGRVRKYYEATKLGRQLLSEAKVKVRELVDEVLNDGEKRT